MGQTGGGEDMSKKHFIDLADRIRYHREAFTDEALNVLVSFCKSQNGRFNESRWRSYIAGECGPNGGRVKA
jgi:hypothetical protein